MTHPSHDTYISDSSLYDEKCSRCGATDARTGSGALERPCPKETSEHARAREADTPADRIAAKRAELMKTAVQRRADEDAAIKNGTFWSFYGSLTVNRYDGSTRAHFCVRHRRWNADDQAIYDSQHAGANAFIGPMDQIGEKGDAVARIIGGIVADQYSFSFI